MWNKIEQVISAGSHSTNVIAGRDAYLSVNGNIPTALVDQKTEEEVKRLRRARFFAEFDVARSSLRLGKRLATGELSGGSDEVRGDALAWCARFLSRSDNLEQAAEFLERAKAIGALAVATIAEAFIISQTRDKVAALNALASIDSDVARSARLMIVAHHESAERALSWMSDAGYTIVDLDSDGKSFVLTHQLRLGRWEEAAQTLGTLSEADFLETPVLHHLAGLATLVRTIPEVFRAVVLTQVPFEAADFPLASDAVAMAARRAAHTHFLHAVEPANQLACPRAARIGDEYALWLELRDPVQSDRGKNRLEDKLRDLGTALGFVHYALRFGVKLNLSAVEQEIERSVAINGGPTIDSAISRFALALAQPTPEGVANYIARHHDQLAVHIDSKLIRLRQIEMLSRAGLIERAKEVLDQGLKEGISIDQANAFRTIISDAQSSDPVESRKSQYEKTRALGDLINLVCELEERQRWDDLCEFGLRLFEETHSLGDAERAVVAFKKMHRSEALVDFLRTNADLLSQSGYLRMSYAWALYYEGDLLESRSVLAGLSDEVGSANYRALQVNIGIATGDWASLSAYIAEEYRNRNDRSANALIRAAKLALYLGSSQAKDLVSEAAAKADHDSGVLVAAYLIATSAGWEADPQVFQWLERAAEISGDDGPLQRMSLKDLLDRKPEWDRRESETRRLLAQGHIPMFIAAQSFNQTLIDLTTFAALANLTETDPRRRSSIPAYSGNRVALELHVGGKSAAMDATALLTLSFLNILDVAIDAFETVYIPHSTLAWLFEERQKATFHQPSRIANARKVRDFLATGVLDEFTSSTVASSDLSAQVGDELAALIAEAEKVRDGDDTQHIVVRSAPVHRLSTLMEEEADLSAHATVLSSCLVVVDKLRQKGQLTANEERWARAYLQLHEKPWPNQPDIADRATLYLDDLSIAYFLHLGLLGKIKAAGLTAVVSPRELSEANALIFYELISEQVKDVIERLRASLNSRIESGHVRVSGKRNFDELETQGISEHPSIGVLSLAPKCDFVIMDDRCLNQHQNIESGGVQTPVFSTLDLLDGLVADGVLSDDERLEHRTRLRRAGYCLVPVSVEELERCLVESTVAKGKVVETAELKAIRESILRVRMSNWLGLPEEAPWLDGTLKALVRALRNLWVDGVDIEEAIAHSIWLVEQIDVRGWAHRLVPENADNVVRIERAAFILLLLMPLTVVQERVVDAYWNWVEERILAPIQEQFPEVYHWLVEWHGSYVAEMVETQLPNKG